MNCSSVTDTAARKQILKPVGGASTVCTEITFVVIASRLPGAKNARGNTILPYVNLLSVQLPTVVHNHQAWHIRLGLA